MAQGPNSHSVLHNLDLANNPPDSGARGYTQPLKIADDHPHAQSMGVFLEAAGWVRNGRDEAGHTCFAPPVADHVARLLRSCVVDLNSARRFLQTTGQIAHRKSLNILDAKEGTIPHEEMPISPQAIVMALGRKILHSENDEVAGAKEEIATWTKALNEMVPEDEAALQPIGADSGRAYSHPGEILISIDRQAGSISFLPTGDAVGAAGPYSQKTRLYDAGKRKASLAVVYHRGSAVRANASKANPKALEKSIFRLTRHALAKEIVAMSDEDFNQSFGEDSLKKMAGLVEQSTVEGIGALAHAARRARESLPPDSHAGERERAAKRIVEETDAVDQEMRVDSERGRGRLTTPVITHPLDLLLPAAGKCPWLFPSYVSREVHRKGVIHLHGNTGTILRGIFSEMARSEDFVLHSEDSETYRQTYQEPFEGTIQGLAEELDREEARRARRAHQRVRIAAQAGREKGSVGFLELVRGRGVVFEEGQTPEPEKAMAAMIGPGAQALGGDPATLREMARKIDALADQLGGGGEGTVVGSIRDFCTRICRKPEVPNILFGEENMKTLRAARAELIKAEAAGGGNKEAKGGKERADLQGAVTTCLCTYFFGATRPQPHQRELVDRLVAAAANTEFIYFAGQVGGEGLLKIGKAVEVERRTDELSKDGQDVFPLAYVAVPGIPVGDWTLDSVIDAVRDKAGEESAKEAVTAINRLTGFFRKAESGGTAEFFFNAVRDCLAHQNRGGEIASLTPEEVESLLAGTGQMRPATARAVHGIVQAVCSSAGEGGAIGKQKRIREASAHVLSLLAAQYAWKRIPGDGVNQIKDGFYAVDEVTQMPKNEKAWPHRIQTGALVEEGALHRENQIARVHGEWFYLLNAVDTLVSETEKKLQTRAVRCGDLESPRGLAVVVSDLQESGMQVCTKTDLLPHDRRGYKEKVEAVVGQEREARMKKGKNAQENKQSYFQRLQQRRQEHFRRLAARQY